MPLEELELIEDDELLASELDSELDSEPEDATLLDSDEEELAKLLIDEELKLLDAILELVLDATLLLKEEELY